MKMNIDPIRPGERVLCAVSGGADSMYLLCRMLELKEKHGFEVCCAHFDHGMRGEESGRDAAFVAAFCASRGVPCRIGRGAVQGGEAEARQARYAFLRASAEKQGCQWIATAHTADDNAETLLLQLARGAGLRGLGGIAPVRENLLRPMLDVTRAEVETWLSERGIPHVDDSSNASPDYARNRVRQGAMPALRSVNSAFARHTVQTAALLREDEAFLASLAQDFLQKQGRAPEVPALAALASSAQSGRPYDFVFSDLWMPKMNGLELVERLRADPRFEKLPVFALTADTESQNDARTHLFNGILLKPITCGNLVAALTGRGAI